MIKRTLIAGTVASSLLLSGCAGNGNDDMAGALLIGAAVVGIGILAATAGSDDDHDDGYDRRSRNHRHSRYEDSDYRYANNGRCDDPRYRTSNGGRASPGTDERDCRRYGDGLK